MKISSTAPAPTMILEGNRVRLEPLLSKHSAGLLEFALEPDLWAMTQKHIRSREDFAEYMQAALAAKESGVELPFAVVERSGGRSIGSTRYSNMDLTNRRLEIGWTWIGLPWHGTGINAEMKYLMLRHAFEDLGFMRVEFKANGHNTRSRAALRKLGAKEEGVFRKWRIGPDGRVSDTAWYSILDDEWPAVKTALEVRISGKVAGEA